MDHSFGSHFGFYVYFSLSRICTAASVVYFFFVWFRCDTIDNAMPSMREREKKTFFFENNFHESCASFRAITEKIYIHVDTKALPKGSCCYQFHFERVE